MMKNKLHILLLPLLLLMPAACNDFLQQEPISDLTAESFWQTPTDAEVGVQAIYNAFSLAMSSGLWDWGELRADNFIPHEKDAWDQAELINNTIQTDNQAASWTQLFSVIARANDAIRYIPNISITPATKNNLLAEAHAMRAWAYFYCVRVWGDLPLYTEPVKDIADGIYRTRTDQNKILQEVVLSDLERAYYLIAKTYPEGTATPHTRMNPATICALMMDVNAWMHNYEAVVKIKEEKADALSRNRWGLVALTPATFQADWRNIFFRHPDSETPIEVLFKIAYDKDGNGENQQVNYFASSQPRVYLSDAAKGIYTDVSDKRFGATQWEDIGSNRSQLNRKFWQNNTIFGDKPGRDYSDNSLVLYRYADIVLLYAEALNEIDRTADAIRELNRTRERAGAPAFKASDFTDKREVLDAILKERQKEFLGEGKRWFDLLRTNRWKETMQPINGMNDPRQVLFPIHRDHLNQNYNLVQNEGY
ncbi:MAG: RagB/SusD family nutrient uptake outer membrane protein [Dysgonamonadaceae bacterium]|jgi:hypothetical protein|nr:RagB/SusD family nutrient uptake outer membrane protein [Dysgonamonadaceae bacterium]